MVAISLAILSGCLSDNKTSKENSVSEIPYDENLLFIYISEMNDNALNQFPLGNFTSDDVSLNEDTKNIYFYNQQLMPKENTNMMVLSESYNIDVLLSQKVKNTNGNEFSQIFKTIQFEEAPNAINNEGRLFLNEDVKINRIDGTDSIQVIFANEEFTLEADDHKDFSMEENGSRSRVLIRNYGLWEKDNMNHDGE